MNNDIFRDKLEVKMYCSKHPEVELKLSSKSNVGLSSAYDVTLKVLILPCSQCEHERMKMKNAIRNLIEESNKE